MDFNDLFFSLLPASPLSLLQHLLLLNFWEVTVLDMELVWDMVLL